MSSTPVVVTERLLAQLEEHLAGHVPERGGALMGGRQPEFVSHLIPDLAALRQPGFYSASDELRHDVREAETHSPYRLIGITHSHPGGLDQPSEHDCRSFADQLKRTPTASRLFFPIVTRWKDLPSSETREHELALPSGKVSMFVAYRDSEGGVRVATVRPVVNPLDGDVGILAGELGMSSAAPDLMDVEGRTVIAHQLESEDGRRLLVLSDTSYPVVPPQVLWAPDGGQATPLALEWPWNPDRSTRLDLLRRAVRGAAARSTSVRDGLAARTGSAGRLAQGLSFFVLGAGSVGSVLAENLVRSGVERLTLADFDEVEAANLSRTVYEYGDVGAAKVDALAERLIRINPAVQVTRIRKNLRDVPVPELVSAVAACDGVVGASDDPGAQALLNHVAYEKQVPGVFIALYRRAAGGEVVWTMPSLGTSCYRCATAVRHNLPTSRPENDYTTGRLAGEVALGTDIAGVTLAGAKVALAAAAMARALRESEAHGSAEVPSDGLSDFLAQPAVEGKTFIMFGNTPDFDFFPRVFAETPNQHAWQSVWLRIERVDDCPVCGTAPTPTEALGNTRVDLAELQAGLAG